LQIIKIDQQAKDEVIRNLQSDAQYAEYMQNLRLKQLVRTFPAFQSIDKQDMNAMVDSLTKRSVPQEEVVIRQGDPGGSMYFIESGTFECVDDKTGKILATLGPGDYFGELSLILERDRAATIRATSDDGILWQLGKEEFVNAVECTSVYQIALKTIEERYHKTSFWGNLKNLQPKETLELAHMATLPKKKKVSAHSTLSVLATGFALCTM
jgi:CRP-like cAMP-binding protein